MTEAVLYRPRLGLSREEAAEFIGVGTTKFDELVADKRMPAPKRIDKRKLWNIEALRLAFIDLPDAERGSYWEK